MSCSGTSRPPKRGADTEVDPAPEGQGGAGVASLGFVVAGVWEDARVPAGSGQPEKELFSGGQIHPSGRHRRLGDASPDGNGWVAPEDLVDSAGDEIRVVDQLLPPRGLLEAESEQDRGDLFLPQRLGVLVVDVEESARETVHPLVRFGRDQLAQLRSGGRRSSAPHGVKATSSAGRPHARHAWLPHHSCRPTARAFSCPHAGTRTQRRRSA